MLSSDRPKSADPRLRNRDRGIYSMAGSLGIDIKKQKTDALQSLIREGTGHCNRVKVYKKGLPCRCGYFTEIQFAVTYNNNKEFNRCHHCIHNVLKHPEDYAHMITFITVHDKHDEYLTQDARLDMLKHFDIIDDEQREQLANDDHELYYPLNKNIANFIKYGNMPYTPAKKITNDDINAVLDD